VAKNIRYFADHGVEEVSGTHTVNRAYGAGDRDAMRSWVFAKLLWDSDLDVNQLIADFCYGYYGPAAQPMIEYDKLLRESLAEHFDEMLAVPVNRNYPMDVPMYNKPVMEKASALFDEAEALAAENPEIVDRIRLDRLSIAYVQLMQGPEVWGAQGYSDLIGKYEEKLLFHLKNTRFARPWHEGESPENWRTYWRQRLATYLAQEGRK
jgi:hypothetical protein